MTRVRAERRGVRAPASSPSRGDVRATTVQHRSPTARDMHDLVPSTAVMRHGLKPRGSGATRDRCPTPEHAVGSETIAAEPATSRPPNHREATAQGLAELYLRARATVERGYRRPLTLPRDRARPRRFAGVSRQKRLVGARREAEARRGPRADQCSEAAETSPCIWSTTRTRSSPHRTAASAVAPEARSPSIGRPHAHRRRWTGGLVVTLAAATAAQLVASRVNRRPGATVVADRRPRTRAATRPPSGRRRPALVARRVASPVTSAVRIAGSSAIVLARSASPPCAACPSGRRARDRRPLPGSSGRPPAAARRGRSRRPRRRGPRRPTLGNRGTGAAHEFGFEG